MNFKKRDIAFVSACALLFALLIPSTLSSQAKKPKIDQLAREADVVVVGKVGKITSEWNADKSRIQTRVMIEVDQTISGNLTESTVPVLVPGGEVDGVGEWYSHAVRFEKEEQVVLFAKKDPKGHYTIPAGEQGKFQVKNDKATGAKMIPNLGTLEEFTTQIKRNLKSGGIDRGK